MLAGLIGILVLLHQGQYLLAVTYDIEIETITVCPGNDQMRYSFRNMSYKRINRTHSAWSFQVTFADDLGDNIYGQSQLERWSNGRWLRIPFLNKYRDPCRTMLKLFPEIWKGYAGALHVEHPDKCPIPKGNYTMENYILPMNSIDFPLLNGRLRVTSMWSGSENMETIYYCLMMIINIKEKL